MISLKYIKWILLALIVLFNSIFGAEGSSNGAIAWSVMVMTLFGGLALFLYGMDKMSTGMKKAAGDGMRKILAAVTKHRILGLIAGAFVTMVIQSSSATTVMLVSFVQAQLMTFTQSLGVILGADIGTTVTAQLIAFKLTDYALLMVAIGFTIRMFAKNDTGKHIGDVVLGFGLLFFGMKLMSDAMKPLRTYIPFIDMLKGLENPLLGLLVGAIFTALIQSSSAFTGIIIVLAQQGFLTLEAGIPLLFGANLGTSVTAALASIGTSREAKRVALAHTLFKVGGILLFILWIPTFADIVRSISPVGEGSGSAKLAMETPRQIANAHTIFNVSLAFIFLPFTKLYAKLLLKILPVKETERGIQPSIWHLDDSVLSTPAIAIQLAKTEMSRMAKILGRMLDSIIHPFMSDERMKDEIYEDLDLIEGIIMRDTKIDYLDEKITEYLMQLSRQELSKNQANEVFTMMTVVNDMESIGDTIKRDMLSLVDKKKLIKEDFSDSGKQEILELHSKALKQMNFLRTAFESENFKKVKKIIKSESKYRDLERKLRATHMKRVKKDRAESIATHSIHMELLDMLKQVNTYLSDIAKSLVKLKSSKRKK